MKAEYKRDLQSNYLILEVEKEETEQNYGLVMAERNEIPGLLKVHCSRKNGSLYLYYEITSKQTLESVYEKKYMSGRDILNMLTDIRNIFTAMQKYLLNPGNLIFSPEFVFMGPDRRVELCYFPEIKEELGLQMLAEFILKRLDHEDSQAVALGYRFYQGVCKDNFSLGQVWKELILSEGEEEWPMEEGRSRKSEKSGEIREEDQRIRKADREDDSREGNQRIRKADRYREVREEDQRIRKIDREDDSWNWERTEGYQQERKDRKRNSEDRQEQYEVIHKVRKKSLKKKKLDWFFEKIHPAVLLSGLFFTALIEGLFYFGMIHLTEAGGLFFLMLSVEMLIHKFWRQKKENKGKKNKFEELDEESEAYRKLQEEMYQSGQEYSYEENDSEGYRIDELEETRCLVPVSEKDGIRMIHISGGTEEGLFSDICLGNEVLYVGKRKGESDVILDSPTVSRIHARLEGRDGSYFIKDLNSKNGTFCNEERLQPQESREIHVGDRVAFAQIEYRAVKL